MESETTIAAEKPAAKTAARSKRSPKPAGKTAAPKPKPLLTGVMAVAEDNAKRMRAIATEASKLSGPLRRQKELKEQEIKDEKDKIEKSKTKIEKLRKCIVQLDVEIEAAEAPAIEQLRKMVP